MPDDTRFPPEPSPQKRWWRFLPQFRIRTLFFVVLVVAAFFAGRATQQGDVDRARARAAAGAERLQQMEDFRDNLKPLDLRGGVVTVGKQPSSKLHLLKGTRTHVRGYLVSVDYAVLDISQADFAAFRDDFRDPLATIINDLLRQIYEQPGFPARNNIPAPFGTTGNRPAIATLVFSFGIIEITG